MPNYTILIIDYDPRSIEALEAPLARAGFRVEVAHDGLAGVRRFHEIHPDVTLIEAMIPKKHGFEVCEELKASPHGQSAAVFIVTSVYKGRRYRYQAKKQHGCDEFLEKPVSPDELLEAVKKYVSPPDPQALGLVTDADDEVLSVTAVDDEAPAIEVETLEESSAEDRATGFGMMAAQGGGGGVAHDSRRTAYDSSSRGERAPAATAPARRPRPAPRRTTQRKRPGKPRAVRPHAGISHDRMMLLLAAVLLTVLGAVLAYTVLM